MEKRLLINYSDLKIKLHDDNDKKYKIDLNYESSNYFSCIVVVNSIEDLKKNESVNKLNKNIKKLALIILSNNPIHLEEYSDMIIRQTEVLQRIVDEFSRFARMPDPQKKKVNINNLINSAVLLQKTVYPKIIFKVLAKNRLFSL